MSSNLALTADNVCDLFTECLSTSNAGVTVYAIKGSFIFDRDLLEQNVDAVIHLLGQLPDDFTGRNGASLNRATFTKSRKQWTDNIRVAELLMLLGIALNYVRYTFARELWIGLEDRLPFYTVQLPQ